MWNIATGTLIGKLEVGFAIISITFNPDMNHLMASLKKYDYQKAKIANLDNRNNSIITISLKSFDIEQEWKLDKYGEAPQIEFSHTGKYIMSYTHNQASIRMVETGKILHTEHNVRHISFSDCLSLKKVDTFGHKEKYQ